MDLKLNGKLAVVLGASRGLGGAIAQMLAKEGSSVIAVARNTSSIDEWSKSYPISSYKCDLTKTNDVNDLISFLSIKKISILINNCGGPQAGTAMGQKKETWENAFKAMALPMFSITNALLPNMISQKWGRVVTIGSSGIEQPIYPGIMPIANFDNLLRFSKNCGAEIPRWLCYRAEALKNKPNELNAFYLEFVSQLCEKIIALGAPGIHFYTMNQAEPSIAICQNLGLQ